jgi:hypothetical protein
MVIIRVASSRPAQHRRVQLSQRVENVAPNPSEMLETRILSHPDAVIDARPQMFNEMPIQFRANQVSLSVGETTDARDCHENPFLLNMNPVVS